MERKEEGAAERLTGLVDIWGARVIVEAKAQGGMAGLFNC